MLSENQFKDLNGRQQESGLNVNEFCINEGIAYSTFYYWRKKFASSQGRKSFIPLVVNTTQHTSPKQASTQPTCPSPPSSDDGTILEIVYPNGTKLRMNKDIDLHQLRALVCLYE